ncbi:MAG: DUF2461 domain-containing protein [Chloroflexia bacterium]
MARTKASFPGFPKEALTFLRGIVKNNDRPWFEKNKALYEDKVKGGMMGLVEAVDQELLDFAPDYITEPSKAVFRIHRDVRFAKDKTPYKTNIAAMWHRQNLGKNETASFYVHLDSKELFIGAGIYLPMPETLKILRNHVGVHHEELREILADNQLRKWMGGLQGEPAPRTPKGFLPGHPADDLLKHRMYIVWNSLDPEIAYGPKLLGEVSARFRAATSFVEFLNRPLAGAKKLAMPK